MNSEFVEQLQTFQERPLNGSEQENLRKYVQEYSFFIKQRLRKNILFRITETHNSL